MGDKADDIVRDLVIRTIRKELNKIEWWGEVQDDVKTQLDWIIKHIDQMGSFFARTFMMMFHWEYERRQAEGKKINNPMPGYLSGLLGMRIPEEAYQCGVLPTRALLGLYDYVEPNDSDVAACMFLCNKIDILEQAGILPERDFDLKATKQEIASAFQHPRPKKRKKKSKPPTEENLKWDFDDLESKNPG